MSGNFPTYINEDTIPVFLQTQLGIRLVGDQALNIQGSNPVSGSGNGELLSVSAITTAGTNAGFSAPQMLLVTNWLVLRKLAA